MAYISGSLLSQFGASVQDAVKLIRISLRFVCMRSRYTEKVHANSLDAARSFLQYNLSKSIAEHNIRNVINVDMSNVQASLLQILT
jgi:hypothetical protein